jgi:tetratricopeptide (TPR) repeat protein
MVYLALGRIDEAIALCEAALERIQSTVGAGHSDALKLRNTLARALAAAGRNNESLVQFEAILRQCESRFGPDHKETLANRNNFAYALHLVGRFQEAMPLFQATLKVAESKFGADHPYTLYARNNLAAAYWKAGRLDLSVPLFELVVQQRTAKLGPDHPATLRSQANLGVNLRDAGRVADGLRLMEEALRRARGRPELMAALPGIARQVAAAYDARGQFNRSELLYRDELAGARKAFGPRDRRTVETMRRLARNLGNQVKWPEAESVLRESLAVTEKTEPDSWYTFQNRWLLGGALVRQGKYAEAEPLLLQGYEGMRAREATVSSNGRASLSEAAKQLVQIYEKGGRSQDAALWKARLGLPDPDESMPNGLDAFVRPPVSLEGRSPGSQLKQ